MKLCRSPATLDEAALATWPAVVAAAPALETVVIERVPQTMMSIEPSPDRWTGRTAGAVLSSAASARAETEA